MKAYTIILTLLFIATSCSFQSKNTYSVENEILTHYYGTEFPEELIIFTTEVCGGCSERMKDAIYEAAQTNNQVTKFMVSDLFKKSVSSYFTSEEINDLNIERDTLSLAIKNGLLRNGSIKIITNGNKILAIKKIEY